MTRFLHTLLFLFLISISGKANTIDILLSVGQNKNSSYKEKQTAFKSLFDTYQKTNADSAHWVADKIFKLAKQQNNLIDISNAFLYHGNAYSNYSKQENAIKSYHESLTFARKSKNNNQITKVLINLGSAYKDAGNPLKALEYLNECVKIATENNNLEDALKAYNSIGNSYLRIADYSKAQVAFLKALELNKIIKNELYETVITNNVGNNYYYTFNYDKAIEYYYLSLKNAEKINNEFFIVSAYNNLGIIYRDLGELDKAIANTQKSLHYFTTNNDLYNSSLAYNTIGLIYKEQKKLDSALIYFNKSLVLKNNIQDSVGKALIYNNIGDVYIEKNNITLARKNLSEALLIATRYNDFYNIATAHLSLGDSYFNDVQALNHYKKAAEISSIHNINALTILAYEKLYDYYKRINNSSQALIFHEKYTALNDSLAGEKSKLKIEEIEMIYEVDKKNTEILLLQKEKELKEIKMKEQQEKSKTQLILIVLVFSIVLLSLIIFVIRYRQIQKNKINSLEKRSLKVETDMLRSQINPHFIFNSLNSIQTFVSTNETLDAERYLSKFAALMRLILDNSRQSFITLEKEIETLTSYLELEKLRFGNRFSYRINLNDIDDEFTLLPPMLAQPYIENAILHGFNGVDNGIITIDYMIQNNKMICTIDDNGIGRKKSTEQKQPQHHQKTSLGIKVTQERIELLSLEHQIKLSAKIIDKMHENGESAGTKVIIEMPYQE